MLFLEQVMKDENNIVAAINGHHVVAGHSSADFGFSMTSTYEPLLGMGGAFNRQLALASHFLKRFSPSVGSAVGRVSEKAGDSISAFMNDLANKANNAKTFDPSLTASEYQGTEKVTFSVPFVFLALTRDDNPLEQLNKLLTFTSASYSKLGVTYDPTKKKDQFGTQNRPAGLTTIRIGNWFEASRMVPLSVEWSASKQVGPNGNPIAVVASLTVESYTVPTQAQLAGWFKTAKIPENDNNPLKNGYKYNDKIRQYTVNPSKVVG